MIENLPEVQAEPSKLDYGVGYDEITDAFLQSIEPFLQLANLAYGSSHTETISAGRRRALERVGIRATDLVTELVTFVKNES